MPDGAVVVYNKPIRTVHQVFEELQKHGGIAYYWLATDEAAEWYRIDTYTHSVSNNLGQLIYLDDNPHEMVLLAAMLE